MSECTHDRLTWLARAQRGGGSYYRCRDCHERLFGGFKWADDGTTTFVEYGWGRC
jgi:hypothetical protein